MNNRLPGFSLPTAALALCALTAFSLLPEPSVVAQEAAASQAAVGQKKKRDVNPVLKPIQEQAGLPRVLLIGDSISMGYTVPVREMLQGRANVVRPLTNCGPTSRGVESIDAWLGDGKWDVIHFNFGLHDMVFYSADGKERAEPTAAGARYQVSLEQYEQNLQKLVARMKQTGAVLIWCTTTPVPEGSAGRRADDAVIFNQVAAKVMSEHNIRTNDLHAWASARLSDIQQPKNVHFSPAGSKVLAEQVVRSIEAALPAKGTR